MLKRTTLLLSMLFAAGCAGNSIFPDIDLTVLASPSFLAVDADAKRLYVVNSNSQVLYKDSEGSFQVYDLTTPTAPNLIGSVMTASFSGQAYVDSSRLKVYMTNRYGEYNDSPGNLLIMNVDESTTFPTVESTVPLVQDPYGLSCCYPDDRLWTSNEDNVLQYWDIGTETTGEIDLLATLDTGYEITNAVAVDVVVYGNQAFVTRRNGGLMIVNLDETAAEAVDYYIDDVGYGSGLAHDGTYLYVATVEKVNDDWTSRLLVLDVSSLTPVYDNTEAQVIDKDDDGILVDAVEVAKNPDYVMPFDGKVWVTSESDSKVSVVDMATWTKTTDIEIKKKPFSIASYEAADGSKYVYVGALDANTISIIDSSTDEIVATFQ